MTLSPGDPAPAVAARDQRGERVAPDFDDTAVVFFYPEDGTPGCTTEAAQFTAEREVYDDAGVAVYGVSTDDVDDHAAFAEAEDLDLTLLADPDGEVADAFGVPTPQGRAERTTFVLADGAIHAVYEDVDPDGHARDVMMDLLDDGVVELEGL